MASVIRVQIRRRSKKPLLVWFNRNSAPRIEARALLVMVRKKSDTVENLRKLISVPPESEARLRAYARLNPIAGREIETSLRFRKRVLEEFERIASKHLTKR